MEEEKDKENSFMNKQGKIGAFIGFVFGACGLLPPFIESFDSGCESIGCAPPIMIVFFGITTMLGITIAKLWKNKIFKIVFFIIIAIILFNFLIGLAEDGII